MRKSIASICVLLTLVACQSDKPEEQVRRAFETCRAAVEAGDAAAAMKPLDSSFQGPEGMDKASAQLFLMGLFRQEQIGVTVVRSEIAIHEASPTKGEAFQEVDLLLTGRSGGGLLPQDTSRRSFRLRWRKKGRDWALLEVQSLDGR